MGNFTIIQADWWKDVKPLVDDSLIVMDKTEFKVTVSLPDEVMNEVHKNATVHAILTEVASALYKDMKSTAAKAVADMNKMIKTAHAKFEKDKDMTQLNIAKTNAETYINTGLAMLVQKTEADIKKAVPAAFNKIKDQLKSYQKFKRDLVINTSLKISAMTLNVIKLVSTGGLDVLAWHSLMKDAIKLADEVAKLSADLDGQQAKINDKLKTLGTNFKKNKAKAKGKEVGDALLLIVFGKAGKTSLIDTKKELKFYEGKVDGIFAKSIKAGEKLTKALDNMNQVKGQLGPEGRKELEALAKEINDLATSIGENQTTARAGKAWAKDAKKNLEAMQAAAGVKNLERLAKLAETAFDGYKLGNSWSSAAKSAGDMAARVSSTTTRSGKVVMRWKDDTQKAMKALAA